MKSRTPSKKFFFSVEGDTERWYLMRLQRLLGEHGTESNVKIDCKVEKDPLARVRGITVLSKIEIVHMFDMECDRYSDIKKFEAVLSKMKKAERLGKSVKYILGYSNLSFELWIILHKVDFYIQQSNCSGYLPYINKYYGESFESLNEYKEEKNFKRLLDKITIEDVKSAVSRAKKINENNVNKGYKEIHYANYRYFRENPSLSLGDIILKLLDVAGIK